VAHGVAASFNQALRQVMTEFVYTTSFGQIMAPGCLESLIGVARPGLLAMGRVYTILPDSRIDEFPTPRIVSAEDTLRDIPVLQQARRQWKLGRNGNTLIHVPSHERLGGFDERFGEIGYGLEDTEYAARWLDEFGWDSLAFVPAGSWHFGDTPKEKRQRWKKIPKPESFHLLIRTLTRLYGERYNLFTSLQGNVVYANHVNIDHGRNDAKYADAIADCIAPEWLDDGSALEIRTCLPTSFVPAKDARVHLEVLRRKLHPDGTLVVSGGISDKALAEFAGEIDMDADGRELTKETA